MVLRPIPMGWFVDDVLLVWARCWCDAHGGIAIVFVGVLAVALVGVFVLAWRGKDDASGSAGGEGGCYKNFPVYSSSILLFPFLRKVFCTRKGFVCGVGEVGFETHSHGGVIAFCWCGAVLMWCTRGHCHCVRGGVGCGVGGARMMPPVQLVVREGVIKISLCIPVLYFFSPS
ncbi:hypothetical protein [Bartonella sp. AC329YNZD]|uniref:hypothetical protein n=1 Tax=Bartonella sp. AC329YNZD TaxID=3243452 RepID=UPI0035D07EB3